MLDRLIGLLLVAGGCWLVIMALAVFVHGLVLPSEPEDHR